MNLQPGAWPRGHPHFHLVYWLTRQGGFIKSVPNTSWQSTTTQYCFAFNRLLVTLATSVVSLTATIQYHPGIETCKCYAACKKNPQKPPSGQRKFTPCPELSSLHSQSHWAWIWRQKLAPWVRGEAASPQWGSGLAQTPAETSAAGVMAGACDRGGKDEASRATEMRKLAVLQLNEMWHRYFGHCLLIGLETERLSIKFLNRKSHNEINLVTERNAGSCKDLGFLSNKFQKKIWLGCWCFLIWKIELFCVMQLTLTQNSPWGKMFHSCPLFPLWVQDRYQLEPTQGIFSPLSSKKVESKYMLH